MKLKSTETCKWDCVSLGEVMLRLDPGLLMIPAVMTLAAKAPSLK